MATVLVCGFMSPSSKSLREAYWGSALEFSNDDHPVIVPPVSCMGSAHDRACEIFAYLKRRVVFYGFDHSKKHKHNPYGKDYSNNDELPADFEWDAENQINLVGHSFGGNTIRMLVYLLAIDFFEIDTSEKWIKNVCTISSPLQGSLLTYALGATNKTDDDDLDEAPVSKFSTGYNLGIFAHLYSIIAPSFVQNQFDVGLSHFELHQQGVYGFFDALFGGRNGGGTVPVCEKDNAANDMTLEKASEHCKLYFESVEKTFKEFHFVARTKTTENSSVYTSSGSFWNYISVKNSYGIVLGFRDLLLNFLLSKVNSHHKKKKYELFDLELSDWLDESDGLCSTPTQSDVSLSSNEEDEHIVYDPVLLGQRLFKPGRTYRIDLHGYNHFSIVPFPDDSLSQRSFFKTLFQVLFADTIES